MNKLIDVFIFLHILCYTNTSSKHLGRYSRHLIDDYELVVPRKVNDKGAFISHYLPHFFDLGNARKKRDTEDPVLHYRFPIEGIDHHIELWPSHRFIGPGLVIESRPGMDENYSLGNLSLYKISQPSDQQCHYIGYVRNIPGSRAALSACQGLAGFIKTPASDFLIEPILGIDPSEANGHAHLIYKRDSKSKECESSSNCGTTGSWADAWEDRVKWQYRHHKDIGEDNIKRREIKSQNADDQESSTESTAVKNREENDPSQKKDKKLHKSYNMEILMVADYKIMRFHAGDDITTYLLTIMNMVYANIQDGSIGSDIYPVVIRIITLTTEVDELKVSCHNPRDLLANFCKWQQFINPKPEEHPNHHDIAIMLTRYDLCLNATGSCAMLGLAYLGGICRPDRSCNINEDDGLRLGFTITHEIGHTLGAEHDEGQNGRCNAVEDDGVHSLMGPVITMAKSRWSRCSRRSITEFLRTEIGDCMADDPTDFDYKFPQMPPGIIYDATYQCKVIFRMDAMPCYIGEFCKMLYCQVGQNLCASTGEPPADGTFCAANMWCYRGDCVATGRRPGAVNGEWGEWGPWSECTRTCGVGISMSVRRCDNPPPTEGGRYCLGGRKRYKTCNAEPCVGVAKSFRDIQCSDTNDRAFRGQQWNWRDFPSYFVYVECALVCINEVGVPAVRAAVAIDGTPCKPGKRDVCVSGVCRPVGCDFVIDSGAREDACGVCHGNGTECEVINGVFAEQNGTDYRFITQIPTGAGMISVVELNPSRCSLAVSSVDNSTFYLNGNHHFSLSGEVMFGDNTGVYEIREQKERILIRGPLKHPLNLFLVFRYDQNAGVRYTYSIYGKHEKGYVPKYHWEHIDWEPCSDPCGGGSTLSIPKCTEERGGLVEDAFCNPEDRPADTSKTCNRHPCPASWWTGTWTDCICNGTEGYTIRAVYCARSHIKEYTRMEIVSMDHCSGTKPNSTRDCNETTQPGCNSSVEDISKFANDNFTVEPPENCNNTDGKSQPPPELNHTCQERGLSGQYKEKVTFDNNHEHSINSKPEHEAKEEYTRTYTKTLEDKDRRKRNYRLYRNTPCVNFSMYGGENNDSNSDIEDIDGELDAEPAKGASKKHKEEKNITVSVDLSDFQAKTPQRHTSNNTSRKAPQTKTQHTKAKPHTKPQIKHGHSTAKHVETTTDKEKTTTEKFKEEAYINVTEDAAAKKQADSTTSLPTEEHADSGQDGKAMKGGSYEKVFFKDKPSSSSSVPVVIDKLNEEGAKLLVVNLHKPPASHSKYPSQSDDEYEALGNVGRIGSNVNQTILQGQKSLDFLHYVRMNASTPGPIQTE